MPPRRIAVVPHTHWDREWYEPFQTFRLKLVELLDALIPLLERDPSYARYLLDGQMAVVDDYLEVRPEMEARLRRLAASGRVSVGPWYILMDEFLVSGETIIRDLQMGIERGAAFGGVTSVGYLPDMFGHIAQMPQILQLAGFSDTVLWRGVPSAITKSAFNWVAPDGSTVRAEYLVAGYGNGASLPADAKALVRRVSDYVSHQESYLLDDILFMNGSDHLMPQPHLGRVLAEANDLQDDFHFAVSSLAEYLSTAPTEGLETWSAELRSGFRSNILMGVLSNRVDVKREASRSEVSLERRAEPLSTLFLPRRDYPDALLRHAWREVVRNAAHDSICACSVDETVDAVLHRFHESREIGDGLAACALDRFARSLRDIGVTVVNLSPVERSGIVETVVTGDEFTPASMQLVDERGALPSSMLLEPPALRAILSIIQGTRIDDSAWVTAAELGETNGELTLDVTVGAHEDADVELDAVREQLMSRLSADPSLKTRITLNQPPIRRVLGLVHGVPGYGWSRFVPAAPTSPVAATEPGTIANGIVDVVVDPTDGTFSVNGTRGFGRLVDGGDFGDSYNYSPPAEDSLVERPEAVSVTVLERGPLRARLLVERTYQWPERIDAMTHRRSGSVTSLVNTTIEVRADDPSVTVTVTFVNLARDHRLRVHLPLPEPATVSRAECAFTVVERGLTAEGRPEEFGLPTFPSRRFVTAGGLAVAHQGLHEYELVDIRDDGAHEIALTLVRSTGMLSRLGMTLRPLPAGPLTPVEGLQMVGSTINARFVVALAPADPYQLADSLLVPLETVAAPGGGTRPSRGSALAVRGAQVSAVRRVGGVREIRVFNPSSEPTTVEFPHERGWIVDLRGRGVTPFESSFPLRPHEIATFRLAEEE